MTSIAFALAIVAALRGVWSPCGLSMLSTITPLAEHARGHSYRFVVCWFIAGATLGGAALGASLCLLAVVGGLADVGASARLVVVASVACLGAAADAQLGGIRLPVRPRQVNAKWVESRRQWAYASGFGFQLGTSVGTYVMTNATYVVLVMSVFLLAPSLALLIGVAYGVSRGLTILVGSRVTSPQDLLRVHRTLDRFATPSLAVAILAQLGVVIACAVALRAPVARAAAVLVGLALCIGVIIRVRTHRRSALGAA
jgi:hypothetical protein